MNRTGSSVGVIGGGLGGLAAACVAAARGHKVTLYDKNGWLGGKAAVLREGGFRFDMGPTILTVPRVLARIFAEAGRDVADYLDLRRLDPQWRCFFDDGGRIDLVENVDRMADAMDQFAPNAKAGAGYRNFQRLSTQLHDVSERFFASVSRVFITLAGLPVHLPEAMHKAAAPATWGEAMLVPDIVVYPPPLAVE